MNDEPGAVVAFDLLDGETKEEAIERFRSDLRERGLPDAVGPGYVVDDIPPGYVLRALRPSFPVIGRRRPPGWPKTWR
jgi:hypothetical protein